ncbi:MAG: hypothetical protein RML40_00055 [Bacteroidota bacterium]|nr:hypothetical protein [Bacteroidota bacterium]
MRFSIWIMLIITTLWSCIFVTRTPELPDTRRSSFQPPTSAQIVLSNFQAALREKNPENYVQCLVAGDTASTTTGPRRFVFEPSAEAAARFGGVFAAWSVARERQTFIALTAKIPSQSFPVLTLTNERFEFLSPDSAIFVSDYRLQPNYDMPGAPVEFAGTLRFTILSFPNGFWAISRWSDQKSNSATAAALPSWSILKAQFAN